MGFDPDKYLAEKKAQAQGFDPDAYLAEKLGPEVSMGSKAQASLEGFGQGAAAGYLPHLQAGTERGTNSLLGVLGVGPEAVDAELRDKGFSVPEQSYLQSRDENIGRQAGLKQAAPGYYYGGMLGGVVTAAPGVSKLMSIIPGLGAPAAGSLGRIAQAGEAGLVQGAVQNPGDTLGEVHNPLEGDLQLGERAYDAALGAATGVAVQGAGEFVNKGVNTIRAAEEGARDFANSRAAAAVGLNKAQVKAAIRKDAPGQEGEKIKEMGRYALDHGIVQAGDDITAIANRSGQMQNATGKQIGAAYETASQLLSDPKAFQALPAETRQAIQATNFEPQKMAEDFLNGFKSDVTGLPTGREAYRAAQRLMANFRDQGKIVGIQRMQAWKEGMDDLIWNANKAKAFGQPVEGAESWIAFRDFLKVKIDARIDVLDQAFGKNLGASLKALNKDYGQLSNINRVARDRVAGELGNNFLSITDKIFAGEGAMAGGLAGGMEGSILGLGAGLASKTARTYGRPVMAVGADKTADVFHFLANLSPTGSRVAGGAADAFNSLITQGPISIGGGSANLRGQPVPISLPPAGQEPSPNERRMMKIGKK